MSLPTIGTKWSGNLAFMNDENSLLVDISKMEIGFENLNWAVPDPALLRASMRGLFLQPKAGIALGEAGRDFIIENFGRDSVSRLHNPEPNPELYVNITLTLGL